MKINNLQKPEYQEHSRYDAEITVLRGALAEIYYLLKDRRSRGIENAMFQIETILPDVKNYEYV